MYRRLIPFEEDNPLKINNKTCLIDCANIYWIPHSQIILGDKFKNQ